MTSSNLSRYRQMCLSFCKLIVLSITQKTIAKVFSTVPVVLKIFWIQEKPAYKAFFIFQNISKSTNVFKNHGQCFFKLHHALDIYKKKIRNKWLCLLHLKLIKILIFLRKRAGFFVIQIGIVFVTKMTPC